MGGSDFKSIRVYWGKEGVDMSVGAFIWVLFVGVVGRTMHMNL